MQPEDLRPRFLGCLLGGAAGDALGAAVEFMSLGDIRRRFGLRGIQTYAQVHGRDGAITDDTQMTLFTAEGIIRAAAAHREGTLDDPLRVIHRAYLRWLHTQGERSAHPDYDDAIDGWLVRSPELHTRRAPGNTCLSALSLPHAGSVGHPINDSKGCGGVMRVAPVGLWGQDPWEHGCSTCALTHGHESGYKAGGFMAVVVAYIVAGASIGEAVRDAHQDLRRHLNAELNAVLDKAVGLAARNAVTAEAIESELGAGWVAEEALAIGIACALVARDFESGIRLAVNHSGDSDSTGSIAGNLLGAALGIQGIPSPFVDNLELAAEITEIANDLASAHAGGVIDPIRYPPR
jgi:ADP-ribosylglycohydrolase